MSELVSNIDDLILMGRIGAAHGIKGALRVKSFTANPLSLGDYGALCDKSGNQYNITKIRLQKNITIVHFKEITNRNDAEKLSGTKLFIEREQLPSNLEEEFYIFDMVGMDVLDENKQLIGTILDIVNFGAGDLIEISPLKKEGGFSDKTYYLAFTKENVPEVNMEQHFIKINPPIEIMGEDIDKK